MKRVINIFVLVILVFNTVLPTTVFSSSSSVSEVDSEIVQDIKDGKKVSITETIDINKDSKGRYVAFISKKNESKTKQKILSTGGVISNEDSNEYGKVKALPLDISYMSKSERNSFLQTLESNGNVVAVVPSQIRNVVAMPTINDPLYPNDLSYDSTKQWYLSQPSGANKGIDLYRAWEYLDGQGKSYGGNSEIKVAIIDTGVAYENYSKYDQFSEMTTPDPWVFSKSSDLTDSIFVNSNETANNQIDEDANAQLSFCIDKNDNGNCDAGEYSDYIDDRNGLNVVDWGKYWSRVTYDEMVASPICGNNPYQSSGVKCVSTFSNDSLCQTSGLINNFYVGCYESDMGHPNDTYGHGTFIANIISAKVGNSTAGVGIAPNVEIMPIKIFGETYNDYRSEWVYDSAYGDQIVAAINYAVSSGADIINLSFAGDTVDYYEKIAIDEAYEDGVLVIAASGNGNSTTVNYPAGYSTVMSVGASNKTGGRASYSSYGSTVDISAPVDSGIISQGMWNTTTNQSITKSCTWNTSYKCMNGDPTASPSIFSTFSNITSSGTSFAAPQAVGVSALVKTMYPNLTVDDIKYLLSMSAYPEGSATYSTSTGHGVLNAYNAVRAMDYRGKLIDKSKRIYQSVVASSGYLQTRYSDTYGARWSNWITSGNVKSSGYSKLFVVDLGTEKTVQMMKGTNNGIYFRHANNLGYIQEDDSQWSSWILMGYTYGSFNAVKIGTEIIATWESTNGKHYTRKTTDGVNWGPTNISTVPVLGNVGMIYDSTNSKLLQIVRSSDSYLYTRTSSDSATTWNPWSRSFDYALSDPSLIFVDGRIIRSVRGSGDVIITRYSSDGGSTWSGRNRTYGSTGLTTSTISLSEIESGNIILQTYKAKDGKIYTRRSTDNGTTWSSQSVGNTLPSGLTAKSITSTTVSEAIVNQMVHASNGYLYYRRSTNAGSTWGSWRSSGSIMINGNISLSYDKDIDRVYVTARGTNNKLYTRYSDNKGSTFSSWQSTNTILGGSSNVFHLVKNLDLSIL
jgi:hypothetical protein